MDAFGIRVRYFRKSLKLSQDELAEKSDLHRTYIGAVERGERNISLMNIFRFSLIFNTYCCFIQTFFTTPFPKGNYFLNFKTLVLKKLTQNHLCEYFYI